MAIPATAALIAISGTGALGGVGCSCNSRPVGQAPPPSSSPNMAAYIAGGLLALLVGYGLWGVTR